MGRDKPDCIRKIRRHRSPRVPPHVRFDAACTGDMLLDGCGICNNPGVPNWRVLIQERWNLATRRHIPFRGAQARTLEDVDRAVKLRHIESPVEEALFGVREPHAARLNGRHFRKALAFGRVCDPGVRLWALRSKFKPNSSGHFGSRAMSLQDVSAFASLCENATSLQMAVALAGNGVNTVVKFLSQRGMNEDPCTEAGLTNLLRKCNQVDATIDISLDNEDCDGLRALHMLCRKVPTISSIVATEADSPAAGSAAEEAANATKAANFYKRLANTQGIIVPLKQQLDYSLISQMDNLQHKNGTINRRIGISNIVAQCKKKRSDKDLGMGLKFSMEEGNLEEESYKYNEVTLMLRCFYTGLAAILSYEVDPNADRDGEVPVLASDGSGGKMCVAGTVNACYDLMFETIKAIGIYPLKHADSIFRNSFEMAMELAGEHHFDKAVKLLVEYHPSALRPNEEELREGGARQTNSRKVGQKDKSGSGGGTATPTKKLIDASRPACHGIAYNGACNRPGCTFDHHVGRCKAFKEANPEGPPSRK